MKKKYIKYIFSILLLLVIVYLTFLTVFEDNGLNMILNNLLKINYNYIIIGLFLIFLYFILQAIFIKRILRLLNKKVTLNHGIFYSMIEFFFSGITPSSTGGQPVQLYYMKKDKISLSKALIMLLLNTIYFKLILVIFGFTILIFNYKLIFDMNSLFIILFFVGLFVDFFVVIGGYLLLYNKKLLLKIVDILEKIKIIFRIKTTSKLEDKLNNYQKEIRFFKNNRKELFLNFFIVFFQRLCIFSISYVVYRSFGLSDISYFEVIMYQIVVQITIEFVPLPGGTGVSEYLMSTLFLIVFGNEFASTGMILTRIFSFYIPLILSLIVILVNLLVKKLKIIINKKRQL